MPSRTSGRIQTESYGFARQKTRGWSTNLLLISCMSFLVDFRSEMASERAVIFQRGVHSSQVVFNGVASAGCCMVRSRLTVAGWTWNSRAAAACVCRPDVTISTMAACCCGPSLGRRPPIRPWARATANPACVRSRIIARSNSAKLPTICMSMRPAGAASVQPPCWSPWNFVSRGMRVEEHDASRPPDARSHWRCGSGRRPDGGVERGLW
jgi:hypothetical protein